MAGLHTEGDTINTTNGLKWIVECIQMDLARDAMIQDTEEIVATADTWHTLPSDILEIFEISKSGYTTPYFGMMYGTFYDGIFDIRNTQIRFPQSGTYTLHHYIVPPAYTDLAQAIPIHSQFGYPISLWVARRHKYYYDESSKGAQRLIEEYGYAKSVAIKNLAKIRPTTRAPRRVRVGLYG